MEYLKIVKSGVINSSCNSSTSKEFDSCGCKARFKVSDGTGYIYCGMDGYKVSAGEYIEFIGKIRYYGIAEIHYILFDKT